MDRYHYLGYTYIVQDTNDGWFVKCKPLGWTSNSSRKIAISYIRSLIEREHQKASVFQLVEKSSSKVDCCRFESVQRHH